MQSADVVTLPNKISHHNFKSAQRPSLKRNSINLNQSYEMIGLRQQIKSRNVLDSYTKAFNTQTSQSAVNLLQNRRLPQILTKHNNEPSSINKTTQASDYSLSHSKPLSGGYFNNKSRIIETQIENIDLKIPSAMVRTRNNVNSILTTTGPKS